MNRYAFISEVMRTGYWAMLPSAFHVYRDRLLNFEKLGNERIGMNWPDKRQDSYFHAVREGSSTPEMRLFMTRYPQDFDNDYYADDVLIHVMPLTGPITHGGAECAYGTLELADRFRYADMQKNVIGHLVILDTPGGAASANDLNELFANANKPVVGLIRGMNASKGVWISSFIPDVFAEREDVDVGCVGTLWSVYGQRNGVTPDNEVYYEVYADNSTHKNEEYRAAVQDDNLDPAKKTLNEIDQQFRDDVKRRWPGVPDDKLTGRLYKARDVIGELVDGIKSYSEAIDYIFEKAGMKNPAKNITPIGSVSLIDGQDGEQANINPQKSCFMTNIDALEKILGKGTVALDESGEPKLTTEQLQKLNEAFAEKETEESNASLSGQVIAKQQLELDSAKSRNNDLESQLAEKDRLLKEKEAKIRELAESTSHGIEQPPMARDNGAVPSGQKDQLVTSDNLPDHENVEKMYSYLQSRSLVR